MKFSRWLCGLSLAASWAALAAPPDATTAFFEKRTREDPLDFLAWNRLAARYLQLQRLSGEDRFLSEAAQAAAGSLRAMKPALNPGGLESRGRVELARHLFASALATGRELAELQPSKNSGLVLQSDALFELGDYADAAATFAEAMKGEPGPSVGSESRLSKYAFAQGNLGGTREHLENALKLTAAEETTPETLAWCHVQLGELAFRQGRWEDAGRAYEEAAKTLPGWWVTEDHRAELLGARGEFDPAIAAYRKLIERLPRPELLQALGDLLTFAGHPGEAGEPYAQARRLYEASERAGEILYLHHGAGFFCDSIHEPALALSWSERDAQSRHTYQAWDGLGWSQYRAGKISEAGESLRQALATGVQDPHILYHAGMINMSAGQLPAGRDALQRAVQLNPHYNTFHVHR